MAYGQGADFLEQDVVATRDQALVVLHDIHLDDVSDVAQKFPGRHRDGHYYVVDFTRAELADIALSERRQPGRATLLYPGRFPFPLSAFRIVGLDEEIQLIAGLNQATGRQVGIYPEIKHPDWHRKAGIDLTRLVHDALHRHRELLTGPVFVQSFDAAELRRLRDEFGASWPLVQLLDASQAEVLGKEPAACREIAAYAAAVGLPYTALIRSVAGKPVSSGLAEHLAAAGLVVHPYTLRRDLPPPHGLDYTDVLRFLIEELRIDALFCDHPDDALAIRNGSAA